MKRMPNSPQLLLALRIMSGMYDPAALESIQLDLLSRGHGAVLARNPSESRIRNLCAEIVYQAIEDAYEQRPNVSRPQIPSAPAIPPSDYLPRRGDSSTVADQVAATMPEHSAGRKWWLNIENRRNVAKSVREALNFHSVDPQILDSLWSHTLAADQVIDELSQPKPVYILFCALSGYGHEWRFAGVFESRDAAETHVFKGFPTDRAMWEFQLSITPKTWEAQGKAYWWRIEERIPQD